MRMNRLALLRIWVCLLLMLITSWTQAQHQERFDLQETITLAVPGEAIQIPAGTFRLSKSLTIAQKNIRLTGAGKASTILDFGEVKEGGQGILVRAPGVIVEGLSILDAPGDGLVARGVERLVLRDIGVRWINRRSGGYGVYPVQCKNVIIDSLVVAGAVEAGIYVGQTSGAQVTNSYVFNNVVGIDIENSSSVVIQGNTSKNNGIGLSITGRPHLFLKNPKNILVIQNTIESNNLRNFAPEASFVNRLGSGVGVVLTAVQEVSVVNNLISDHRRAGIEVINYQKIDPHLEGDSDFNPEFKQARFRDNVLKFYDESPFLELYSEYIHSKDVGSAVILSGYSSSDIDTDFACFHPASNFEHGLPLSITNNLLYAALPCGIN